MASERVGRIVGSLLAIVMVGFAQSKLEFTSKLEVTSKLGFKFYSLVDEKSAVADAQKNLAADAKNPALLMKLAQAQFSVWEDKEAVETLTRGLSISPQNADFLIERGHRELPLREFANARADLKQGATLNPKSMAAYYHLGLAHYFLGEFAESSEAFGHAVENAPNTDERSTRPIGTMRRCGEPAKQKKQRKRSRRFLRT